MDNTIPTIDPELAKIGANLIINVVIPKTKEYGFELKDFPVEFTAYFAERIHRKERSFAWAKDCIDFLIWTKAGKWKEVLA